MRIESVRIGERHRKDLGDIKSLAQSIADVGLLHPIVVTPDGILIAGARRLAACQLLGWQEIPATVVDLQNIVQGEHDENVYRKDFAPSEWVAIRREVEPLERAAAEERQIESRANRGENFTPRNEIDKGKSLNKVAVAVGVSRPTLEKATRVVEAAEAEPERFGDLVRQMDETGKVDRAYKMVRRELQRDQMREIKLPPGTFNLFYADPPWFYGNDGLDPYGHAERHYPTLTTEQLCALPVSEMAAKDAVLFLWVTSPMLETCFDVIHAWGFQYKTSFVWDKVKHNFGYYNSVRHEFLLVCTRGSFTPESKELVDSVVSIERSEIHSKKPDYFRQLIERLYSSAVKLELFARESHEGWATWGNEL